jgi:hypothetical protein
VYKKNSVTFWPLRPPLFHRKIHRPHGRACGKEVRVVRRPGFSPDIERTVDDSEQPCATASRAYENAGGSPCNRLRAEVRLGYPSSVCSNTGDAVDRLAAAIDQLANDARDDANDPELAARVAGLWQMVSDLDPELARRTQGYTAPPGGATSD